MNPEYFSHLRSGVVNSTVINRRLADGAHVHTVRGDDEYCAGGDHDCPIYNEQLKEALEAWHGS